jgi:hypothetical protein
MRQNVDPKVWGPNAWAFLRHCAIACDETSSESYKNFLELLPKVLPCEQCREHSGAYIAANPVDTGDLVTWLDRFQAVVANRRGPESGHGATKPVQDCGGAAKLRTALFVLCAVAACVALALLVVTLVKLTKANLTK